MQRRLRCPLFVLSALTLASFGCKSEYYRAETTLNSDGTVSRAVCQPTLPALESWTETSHVVELDNTTFANDIENLKSADDGKNYVLARGQFASVAELPAHFEKDVEGLATSTMVREHERNDYVFVIEHKWSETLTDVVSLDDMHSAATEMAELYISIAEETLAEGLGPDYNSQPLIEWMRTEGTPLFLRLCDAFWTAAAETSDSDAFELRFTKDLAKIAEPIGLDLSDENGNLVEGEIQEQRLAVFVENIVSELVVRTDGKPLDEATIDAILEAMDLKKPGRKSGGQSPNMKTVMERVIDADYGGHEAYEKRNGVLLFRIVGAYGLFGDLLKFRYCHRMPGIIVSTTGVLMSDQEVEWSFTGSDAFPFGYAMNCRSLEAIPDMQQKLLGGTPITDRASMLKLVALLSPHPTLVDALKQCREAGSFDGFRDHVRRLQVSGELDQDLVRDAGRVLKFLTKHQN